MVYPPMPSIAKEITVKLSAAALVTLTLLLAGCGSPLTSPALLGPQAPPNYNVPFITTDETTQFYTGMTQSTVMGMCGKPLYVAFGSRDLTVWVYEVRGLLVSSTNRTTLAKTSETTMFGDPIHYMALSFQGSTLQMWAPIDGEHLFDHLIFDDLLEEEHAEVEAAE